MYGKKSFFVIVCVAAAVLLAPAIGWAQSRPSWSEQRNRLVDEDVDVRDWTAVLGAMAARVDPARDVFFQDGPPDPLDPLVAPGRLSSRVAVDATRKLPEEIGGGARKHPLEGRG